MAFLIDPKLFAANMRYYRGRQSYTINDLSIHTGLTAAVIQTLESGAHMPTESQLSRVATALLVKREDLVLPRPQEMEYFEGC